MMQACQNCGNFNSQESNFCRFCGTSSRAAAPTAGQMHPVPPPAAEGPYTDGRNTVPGEPYGYNPPPPYSWKTDDLRTNNAARKTLNLPPQAYVDAPPAAPLAAYQQAPMAGNYRCPYCATTFLPRIERKISSAGWVTFALLLVFIFPLFWIGLLIKEDQYMCPMCRRRVG